MRPCYRSVTPAVVRSLVVEHLKTAWPWKPSRSVATDLLLRLLLLAATGSTSVFDVVRQLFSFSHDSAYRLIHAHCARLDTVADGLNRCLHSVCALSRRDRRRCWIVAIDTHLVPYYGQRTAAVVGGPRKAGTKYFHGYATATLIHKGRRYTVALEALARQAQPHDVVRRLLDRIAEWGLKIKGVTADSWFDSGDTLRLLQARGLAYAIPLRRKGRGVNARNRLFDLAPDTVHTAQWQTDRGGQPVTTAIYVWRRRRPAGKTMVIAFAGRVNRALGRLARNHYRARFGIETSYRQKNQARAKTTSRSPGYRLLLEGLAHLIRQVWVLLTEQIGRRSNCAHPDWVGELPLATLIRWLDDALRAGLAEFREIPLGQSDWA
jgi:hypothetical protein